MHNAKVSSLYKYPKLAWHLIHWTFFFRMHKWSFTSLPATHYVRRHERFSTWTSSILWHSTRCVLCPWWPCHIQKFQHPHIWRFSTIQGKRIFYRICEWLPVSLPPYYASLEKILWYVLKVSVEYFGWEFWLQSDVLSGQLCLDDVDSCYRGSTGVSKFELFFCFCVVE